MTEKIKRCPFCDDDDARLVLRAESLVGPDGVDVPPSRRVECTCGACGPEVTANHCGDDTEVEDEEAAAIARWNDAPRRRTARLG